ncbi:hypothetical protein [Amycolatopsis benzoatilytica]|nr:hypothetical protein [Amycolatopsis benzoatilytica]
MGDRATGRPVAVPAEVDVWSTGETGHALRVRVTDQDGTTPWQR